MTSVRSAAPSRPTRHRWSVPFAAIVAAVLAFAPAPAHALRVATWNLMFYPQTAPAARQPNFRTVMGALNPDIIVCQEMNDTGSPNAARDSFLVNVLGVIQPGQWDGQWIAVGSGEGMGIFWKTAKVSVFNVQALGIPTGPRNLLLAGVRVVGYPNSQFFRVYSMHLKAGDLATPADSTTRRLEGADIRNALNLLPAGTNFLVMGDANFYTANEGGYQRLTESQADNDGRLVDPLPMPGNWHVNSLYKQYMTQCPCSGGCIDPAFSGGGMDDRFDLLLPSTGMTDGNGFDMVPGSTVAYGNDGLHFDTDINGDGFNNAVGYAIATALRNSGDHIPVYVDIQVPAKIVAASMLDFGSVIVGAPAPALNLTVANGAPVPGDELSYTLAGPPGFAFTAPGGFVANAGAAGNAHPLLMDATTVGLKAATLLIPSNAADTASKSVLLSGAVLRHAVPSLDSLATVTAGTADFGSRAILHFDNVPVRVHDRGYDALQAKLAVSNAVITGGNGRFSIAGGFTPSQVAGTAATLSIHFDSYGATLDSTYTATLVISSADEPLPGGTAQPSLTVQLSARPVSGVLGIDPRAFTLRFEAARPNPMTRATTFAFELPRDQAASLEIYDLGGRRVATLATGEMGAGRHQASWNALDLSGSRVAGGLYFARFTTAGLVRTERLVVLP